MADAVPELVPELVPEAVPDVVPDVVPEVVSEVVPESVAGEATDAEVDGDVDVGAGGFLNAATVLFELGFAHRAGGAAQDVALGCPEQMDFVRQDEGIDEHGARLSIDNFSGAGDEVFVA
ncbi:MAG: hypothetical protein HC902_09275, partial [Calothrix sp. SM1_5_4]|nr:hypothetical protein [Calothrix sp. SM1_5_4]